MIRFYMHTNQRILRDFIKQNLTILAFTQRYVIWIPTRCSSLVSEKGNNLIIDDIVSSNPNDEVCMSVIFDILNM